MSYARVRTDKMSGTNVSKDLVSAKYMGSGSTATAIENGNIVVIGALLTNERELRKATTPAANSPLASLALVATPEVVKNKDFYTLGDFKNAAGDAIRCYRLNSGDQFSITAEAYDAAAAVAVGDVVEAQASTKVKIVAAATGLTSGSTKIGTVIAIEGDYCVIEVA
jgi:hypothetical protein